MIEMPTWIFIAGVTCFLALSLAFLMVLRTFEKQAKILSTYCISEEHDWYPEHSDRAYHCGRCNKWKGMDD